MTDEKKTELDRLIAEATPEMKMAVLAMLKAAFATKPSKPTIVEACVCLDNPTVNDGCAQDVLSNWGEPERIDCGWSIVVTLNPSETASSFRAKVEAELECMGVPAEVLVTEVG